MIKIYGPELIAASDSSASGEYLSSPEPYTQVYHCQNTMQQSDGNIHRAGHTDSETEFALHIKPTYTFQAFAKVFAASMQIPLHLARQELASIHFMFILCLTVWGIEPDMTHQTFWIASIS